MRKFLFIGVGGSGGATLRYLRKSITERLADVGYTGPFPDAWQFVQLDLPASDDRQGAGLPATLNAAYRSLAPVGVNYDQHRRQLSKSATNAMGSGLDDLCTWWPNPDAAPKDVWFGAGQYRAVGRVITLNRLDQVADAVRSSIDAMTVESADLQLRDACDRLGFNAKGTRLGDLAFVIGSMAGGTGAGGVLDVCDVLRGLAPHGHAFLASPSAVLYTADIFRGVSDKVRGAEPNTLAFISELAAGMKNTQQGANPYMTSAGLATPDKELGPAMTFLIGAGNGEVALPDPLAVYRATALAMSTWVTDPRINSDLGATTIGNGFTLRQNKSVLPMHRLESTSQPCSSFGYARFEVTKRRFRRYAAERLARQSIETLLRGQLDLDGTRPLADAVRDRLSPQLETDFLRQCGISERDEEENDIIDAIRAEAERSSIGSDSAGSLKESCKAAGNELAARILDTPDAGSRKFDLGGAQRKLQTQTEAKAGEFSAVWGGLIEAGVEKWSDAIQQRIVDGVTNSLAVEGLAVTVELLKRAAKDLDTAMGHLQGECVTIGNGGRNAFGHMDQLAGKGGGQVTAQLRGAFATAAAKRLYAEVEVILRTRAIDTVGALKSQFLAPLTAALSSADRGLNESWPAVQAWASESFVPNSFRPDPNVVLLLDIDSFPAKFESLLVESVGGTKASAQRLTAEQVIQAGENLADLHDSAPPVISFSKWDRANRRAATFTVDLDPHSMKRRANEWIVSDTASGIGAFVTEPLQESLAGADKKAIDHFLTRFRAALERSAPLVEINSVTANTVHGEVPSADPIISAIPLVPATGTPLYEGIKTILKGQPFTFDEQEIPALFSTEVDVDAEDISISSVLRGYHPMVFGSVVNSIATAALKAMGEGDTTFWTMRRTRPLPLYVPLGRATLTQLVQGWITGQLLGQIEYTDSTWFGHPFKYAEILVPGRAPAGFPTPGLGRLAGTVGEILATILESYSLAECLFATGHAEALNGYERMLSIGDGTVLTKWIRTGETDVGTPPEAADPADRADLVRTRLETLKKQIGEVESGFLANAEDWHLPPRTWELSSLFSSAVENLMEIAGSAKTTVSNEVGEVHFA